VNAAAFRESKKPRPIKRTDGKNNKFKDLGGKNHEYSSSQIAEISKAGPAAYFQNKKIIKKCHII